MSLYRFYIPPENKVDDHIVFRQQDRNHICNSLRLEEGDQVLCFDGQGRQYLVRLDKVEKQGVEGKVLRSQQSENESPLSISLVQAWLKESKMSAIVRQASELGIVNFFPLITDRCQIKKKSLQESSKASRWREIARQASRQSGRSFVPEIYKQFYTPKEFFELKLEYDLKLLFWENEKNAKLHSIPDCKKAKTAALIFGPEGGWSEDEIELAQSNGFQTISLGPRILRAETAPIAAISVLQYICGDI